MFFRVKPADDEEDVLSPLVNADNVPDPKRFPALGSPQMVHLDARECVNKQIFEYCEAYLHIFYSEWVVYEGNHNRVYLWLAGYLIYRWEFVAHCNR